MARKVGSGACVPILVVCIDIFPPPPGCPGYNPASVNGTSGGNVTDSIGNATETDTTPQPNATDTAPPDIPPVNLTQSDGIDGGGAPNMTEPAEFGPLVECKEGEELAPDGLSCEPITAEEPTPTECGEGEELIDGECQAIPTEEIAPEEDEEDTAPDEEEGGQSELEDAGGEDEDIDEGGADEEGGDGEEDAEASEEDGN